MDDALSAGDIGAGYDEVEVDQAAAAAIAAATASPPADEMPEPPPTAATTRGGRRATSRRTSKRRTAEELTARAAAEDAWVREDLRRIGLISVLLLVLLAVAWVLFGVVDVLGLY
jgi:hypothetical protein